jgi:hypothetical protein
MSTPEERTNLPVRITSWGQSRTYKKWKPSQQGTAKSCSWKLWSAHQEVEDGAVLGDEGYDGHIVHTR